MPATDSSVAPAVLLESLRTRVAGATAPTVGTFVAIILFLPFLLSQSVSPVRIALWAVPIFILTILRAFYSSRIRKSLEELSLAELRRADLYLRLSIIATQFAVGVGIWVIRSPDADPFVLPLFMTLIAMTFCIGIMSNMFPDFQSFYISIPLLIGQPALFWLLSGDLGVSIGISMILAMLLMLIPARRGTDLFATSVLMRFEKDSLLAQVEDEKEKTLAALREAEEANESKTFFMAAASHDIKQPLFALAMLADTLLMEKLPARVREILTKQRRNIDAMLGHFDALMDLGKFQGGRFELSCSEVRVAELGSQLNAEFQLPCEEKGLSWELDLPDIAIATDRELLLRLFRNLLSNAIRFTDDGTVACTGELRGDRVLFTVADTGPGIAEEDQTQVFRQFVRLRHNTANGEGAGLGLSIVEHIDAALDLGLRMESAPGRGTRFFFAAPLAGTEISDPGR